MDLIYITNDMNHASVVQSAGVDRVMVDLEINGKFERQGHLDTVISRHTFMDVSRLRSVLKTTELMVRVNPIFEGSSSEINQCIDRGADRIMLPMFSHAREVERFVEIVDGRAATCLLLETPASVARLPSIAKVTGFDEVHIGLNDLHLGFGLSFMFELLSDGIVDYCASVLSANGIRFGFGGISMLGKGALPSNHILAQHHRLGSSQVILSRDFRTLFSEGNSLAEAEQRFRNAVLEIREFNESLRKLTTYELLQHRDCVQRAVREITESSELPALRPAARAG